MLVELRPNAQLENTELKREPSVRALVVLLAHQATIVRRVLLTSSSIHAHSEVTVQRVQELSHALQELSMITFMEEALVTASLVLQVMSVEPCKLIEELLALKDITAQEDLEANSIHALLVHMELADAVRET